MKRHLLATLLLAAIVILVQARAAQLPEKLRVLSCDLATLAIKAPDAPGAELSTQLKALLEKADPDIVFLEGTIDWENCDRICKLRPGLRVLTCSAFPAVPANATAPQVAILARDRAVLSWVEETTNGQGFAFAMIQAGTRKIGLFSVQVRDTTPASAAGVTERVISEVKKLQQFPKNRPDAFLISGASLTKAALVEAGFENVPSDAPGRSTLPASEFWAANAGFLSRPRSLAIAGLTQSIIVSDIDSANSFPSKFAYQNPLLFPGETPAPVQAVLQQPIPQSSPNTLTIAAIVVCVILFCALLLSRRRNTSMELMPLGANDELAEGPAINDPARVHLVSWLKSQFMRRLLSQRSDMIATEAEATRRTLAIEEKLTHLQVALQDRISAYENRIDRLETELTAATAENRALIRSQIDLLKEKVAKAKKGFTYTRN